MLYIKTLKGKITLIYVFLVFIITVVGLISSFNVYRLGGEIDGLMTNNYKSIAAANNMTGSVDTEDKSILQYIEFHKKNSIDIIYNSNDEFYKYLNIEKNNITEVGEKELADKINENYIDFMKLYSKLQDYQSTYSNNETIKFYDVSITPVISELKKNLVSLSQLNEKAMFNGRNYVKINAERSLYLILIISAVAAITGLFVSMFYTNKSLRPIDLLTETIKSVKEGEINKQAPVVSRMKLVCWLKNLIT